MTSRAAVLRLVPSVRGALSRANAVRLDQTVALLDDSGRAVLAQVLETLYPGQKRDAALTAFRQFRRAVDLAAEEAGVKFSLETDGQTRSEPEDRVVWFEGEDRVAAEVARVMDAEVGDVERVRQDVWEDRETRIFVSYAHADEDLKNALLRDLTPLLQLRLKMRLEPWSDEQIPPGTKWEEEIRKAMEGCDLALLLVSPSFRVSDYITRVELPYLLGHKRVVPVALKAGATKTGVDPHGLMGRQVFFDSGRKAFSERGRGNPRETFAIQVSDRICEVLGDSKNAGESAYATYASQAIEGFEY